MYLSMQARAAETQDTGDEMIISAGEFLIRVLTPAVRRLQWERAAFVALAGAAVGGLHPIQEADMQR
jgi:hypothetical protein